MRPSAPSRSPRLPLRAWSHRRRHGNACYDPYTGEQSLTEAQVARIMNQDYRPEQQIALLAAMRGQTPVADLSDADFAGLFPLPSP